MTQFNLPVDGTTKSQARYVREWRKRTTFLSTLGLRTIGFDPGYLVCAKEGGKAFELPEWFVEKLMEPK